MVLGPKAQSCGSLDPQGACLGQSQCYLRNLGLWIATYSCAISPAGLRFTYSCEAQIWQMPQNQGFPFWALNPKYNHPATFLAFCVKHSAMSLLAFGGCFYASILIHPGKRMTHKLSEFDLRVKLKLSETTGVSTCTDHHGRRGGS